jgi:hypothetical protein
MPASPLRRWLRREPHPVRLRCDGRDVAVGTGNNKWRDTEDSVVALSPSKVEALDANGVLLRVYRLDGDEDEDKGAEEEKPKTELEAMARMLLEAHDAGAQRHAEAYALAFTKMVELVQILSTRLGGLETAWQRAMKETARAQADALLAAQEAQQNEDPAGQAIAMMAAAAMGGSPATQAAAGAAANGATNGAAKKPAPKKGD